ncbi:N-acetyltransferase [Mesorhizobium sp. CAU 1741]|uniref:GNAT family N-acetyltransferase n=1 Tax=Mesorhizobium sp. CAU 1741 TaxID=3140366 RepID=UPI00325AC3D8
MKRGLVIRPFEAEDADDVRSVVEAAFGGTDEVRLVDALRANGDDVLELVAIHEQELYGHILFSRLRVESRNRGADAVALAPLAVRPDKHGTSVGTALVESAHNLLKHADERLSVVLGDPAYYGRFGYTHARAAGFDCQWQGEALQALSWGEAPDSGRLVYADAFSAL